MSCSDLAAFVEGVTSDCCTTAVAKCEGDQITHITLEGQTLSGLPDFSVFQELVVLTIKDMDIGSKDYSEVVSDFKLRLAASSLQFIELSNLGIGGSLDCSLQRVTILDLSDNNISGDIPSCFNGPSQQLKINNNQITGTIPAAVTDYTPQIFAINNPIVGLSSYKPVSLGLQGTKIQSLDLLKLNPAIFTLEVSFKLSSIERISSFTKLITLMILDAEMTGELPQLPNSLKELNLANNRFTGQLKALSIKDCGDNTGNSFDCASPEIAGICNLKACSDNLTESIPSSVSTKSAPTVEQGSSPPSSATSIAFVGVGLIIFLFLTLMMLRRKQKYNLYKWSSIKDRFARAFKLFFVKLGLKSRKNPELVANSSPNSQNSLHLSASRSMNMNSDVSSPKENKRKRNSSLLASLGFRIGKSDLKIDAKDNERMEKLNKLSKFSSILSSDDSSDECTYSAKEISSATADMLTEYVDDAPQADQESQGVAKLVSNVMNPKNTERIYSANVPKTVSCSRDETLENDTRLASRKASRTVDEETEQKPVNYNSEPMGESRRVVADSPIILVTPEIEGVPKSRVKTIVHEINKIDTKSTRMNYKSSLSPHSIYHKPF
eukprot:NODE_386_length_9538_cov_0.348766.p1 type:complete len:608 gc:universal NODE_386_length_9538_cov_0.348766:1970-147(-)